MSMSFTGTPIARKTGRKKPGFTKKKRRRLLNETGAVDRTPPPKRWDVQ